METGEKGQAFKNKAEQEAAGFYDDEDLTIHNCTPEAWNALGGNYDEDIKDIFITQKVSDSNARNRI